LDWKDKPADGHDVGAIDGADYGWPQHGHGIVDHGADCRAGDDGYIADVAEETGWYEGSVFDEVGFC